MKIRVASVLLFVTIVFQHFQLASLGGFPLSLGAVSGTILVALMVKKVPFAPISLVWSLIVVLSSIAALLSQENAELSEYLRTLVLFLFASGVVTLGIHGARPEWLSSDSLPRALFGALALIVILSLTQSITGALDSKVFFNVFGDRQYLYLYNPHLESSAIPRAQGFFLEPSYDAFVIGSVGTALICLNRFVKATALLVPVGLLTAQSATALGIFVVILIFIAIRSHPSTGLITLFLGSIFLYFGGSYLMDRLESTTISSSSANYRLVAPLEVIGDVLTHHPFGQPLGSIAKVLAGYRLSNGTNIGTSLDNGFYVILFYFGWLGLIVLGVGLIYLILLSAKRLRTHQGIGWVTPLWLIGSMSFSGGIMLPEFSLMTWMVVIIFVGVQQSKKDRGYDASVPSYPLNYHRHVPGHRWGKTNSQIAPARLGKLRRKS